MNIEKGLDKIVKTLRVLVTDQPGYLGRRLQGRLGGLSVLRFSPN